MKTQQMRQTRELPWPTAWFTSRARRRPPPGPSDAADLPHDRASAAHHWPVALALALLLGLWAWSAFPALSDRHVVPPALPPPAMEQVRQSMQGLAIPFEANSGQFDERVAFMARTFAGPVHVTRKGQIVYSLRGTSRDAAGWSLTETLAGARPLAPVGGDAADVQVSRFTGPRTYQAATYRNVHLGQAWPGVEVELAVRRNNVEKLFHVAPHADATQIKVQVDGALSLRLGEEGALIVATGHGDVAYTPPVAFQEVEGRRVDVPVRYVLHGEGHGYGFALGEYERSLPLVIDPLLQSTYLGGTGEDLLRAIAIDEGNGEVVVAGNSASSDFPGVVGGIWQAGSSDGFVARLTGDLKTLKRSTYLGGAGDDLIYALAIDANNNYEVVVGGVADASSLLPGTGGAAQPAGAGDQDGFVARLSRDLQLVRTTYLGGMGDDSVETLVLDTDTGDVVVGGWTYSSNFPRTAGQAQPDSGGREDGFVARLSGDLKTLRQSTYLGGSEAEMISTLVLDTREGPNKGDVLVGGYTTSTDLPGTQGGAQPMGEDVNQDGFVARLSKDLKRLRQSTYLGGSGPPGSDIGNDMVYALAIHQDEVLVGGVTFADNFPGTMGGAQPVSGGGGGGDEGADGFVARLSDDLTELRQSTYLGGAGYDEVFSLAIHDHDVVVSGRTGSSNLPSAVDGVQPRFGGDSDIFVARLSATLETLKQSTYLGGARYDDMFAMAVDGRTGDVLVGGTSFSSDFPGTEGGAQHPSAGNGDVFLARLTSDLRAVSPQTITFPPQPAQSFVAGGSFDIRPPATADSGLPVSYASTTPGVCTVSGHTVTMVRAGTCTVVASQDGDAQWQRAPEVTADITITAAPAQPQVITFPPQADQRFVAGGSFDIRPPATADSGLPVSYASTTPGVCTVLGHTVTMVSAGTCTVAASQGGNAQWQAAADVWQNIAINDPASGLSPTDPGATTPIPALGPAALALLGLLAAAGGAGVLRRRRTGGGSR